MKNTGQIIFSPKLLTEDGIFAVSSDGRRIVTKKCGYLLLYDPVTLEIIDKFGAYPNAKMVTFSYSSNLICFFDGVPSSKLVVVELEPPKIFNIDIDIRFPINNLLWSYDSQYIAFCSDLSVYTGIYKIGGNPIIIKGPSVDNFDSPLSEFSPSSDYLCLIKNSFLITYSTASGEIYSRIKVPLNPTGMKFTDNCVIAVWNEMGNFDVYALTRQLLFSRKSIPTSFVKTTTLCKDKRIIVLSTYDDQVEIYDIFSWRKLYTLSYPLKITNSIIRNEIAAVQFGIEENFAHSEFEPSSSATVKPIQNICDNFKLKTGKKYLSSFSVNNKFLATYTPGTPDIVWIRNFMTGELSGVVRLNEPSVQSLKWHPYKNILAVITLDSVIFWSEKKSFAVYSKSLLTSFNWLKAKVNICTISTLSEGVLIYIDDIG